MLLAAPLLAQEDLSRLEMGLGYGNIGFGELYDHRFSGINVYTDINLANWFALSNFLGLYPGPDDTSLYFDIFGPKFTFRGLGRMMPYGTAGIGFGSSRSLFNDADLADLRAGGGWTSQSAAPSSCGPTSAGCGSSRTDSGLRERTCRCST